jgi:uncharacterized protein (TIGR04255 family)
MTYTKGVTLNLVQVSSLMYFPEFERVIYERNPLVEVVCQLRFPPILKVIHNNPVEFQDEIRFKYPLFEMVQPQIAPDFLNLAQQVGLTIPNETAYSFKSEDQKWHLSITKDSISLATASYERYEQFKQRFEEAVIIFERIYKPSFYTRIGIRYRDLIIRSKLRIEDKQWSELIAKRFASELCDSELSSSIQAITKHLILKTEHGDINLHHGLVTVEDQQGNNSETAYLFDTDFYTEHRLGGDEDVWNVLNQFRKDAGRLFRWSITETLHNAMQPQSVDSAVS